MRDSLFPEIEPYNEFYLPVPGGHELRVEECGNPHGRPALFLHGGPGAGIGPKHRRYFDPQHYRIVLFDQRGAGQSRPHAELKANTTWDLVADIELLRARLNIKKWLVFGGSWGSTLALAYAQTHPSAVSHLVLRGIFMCRKEEIEWFYQAGANWIFPDLWQDYVAPIPVNERDNMVAAYYKRLTSDDIGVRTEAAKAWSGWEGGTIKLIPDRAVKNHFMEDARAAALARIECHYFINQAFFRSDEQLLEDVNKIRHIPATIVHGRYDVVCPVKNAFDLHARWPEADLQIIADAGHAADEPGIITALVRATEGYRVHS